MHSVVLHCSFESQLRPGLSAVLLPSMCGAHGELDDRLNPGCLLLLLLLLLRQGSTLPPSPTCPVVPRRP
jgi:hypothetical protein